MALQYTIIIPARYASTRLPGKPLLDIKGKPLIQHVYETALRSQATQIIIATDDQRIADCANSFDAKVIMTKPDHESGTDRLAEVVKSLSISDDTIVVNLQGDEFGLPVTLLDQVAMNLDKNDQCQMATLCERIEEESDYKNPNIVKVVFDKNNIALYFSRSAIPLSRAARWPLSAYRHIGLYAYRAGFLETFTQLDPCQIEIDESLEQLRALYNGARIHVDVSIEKTGIGIDTAEDLAMARTR